MGASHFGVMLRQLRKDRGATLSEVADATGISVPMLSRMERGERLPSSETLKALSAYYGASAKVLAKAAGQQHSLNRYPDSWTEEPLGEPGLDLSLASLSPNRPVVAALRLEEPSAPRANTPRAPVFRAQPISAMFDVESETPSEAVEDATVAAEAAVRQLVREVRRSAHSMNEAERERARTEIESLRGILAELSDPSWWRGA
jgi:transcriptional regulator with XRE-family HTH domain